MQSRYNLRFFAEICNVWWIFGRFFGAMLTLKQFAVKGKYRLWSENF